MQENLVNGVDVPAPGQITHEVRNQPELGQFEFRVRNRWKGFNNITAHFRVKCDATQEQLQEIARFSPVLDVVANGTDVALDIQTMEDVETRSMEEQRPEANPF